MKQVDARREIQRTSKIKQVNARCKIQGEVPEFINFELALESLFDLYGPSKFKVSNGIVTNSS